MSISLFLTAAAAATEEALDVESIKAAMDSFDPATLLPDLGKLFGSLETVCRLAVMAGPVVMLALGLGYLFLAPKEANYYFGYRCYFGMGSVRAWRFTQRLAGIIFTLAGLILTVLMGVISGGFGAMEVMDMVWKAVNCLVWEAVLAVVSVLAVNLMAMAKFDRRGNLRRRPPRPRQSQA